MTDPADQTTIRSEIRQVLDELDAIPDRTLGGSATAARGNAVKVSEYLLALLDEEERLPRHAGRPSPGKAATAIAERTGSSFNRQNFVTNEWCSRMLSAFSEWEGRHGGGALAAAAKAAADKAPAERRHGELEREILLLRAENLRLRRELAAIRSITAATGRLP